MVLKLVVLGSCNGSQAACCALGVADEGSKADPALRGGVLGGRVSLGVMQAEAGGYGAAPAAAPRFPRSASALWASALACCGAANGNGATHGVDVGKGEEEPPGKLVEEVVGPAAPSKTRALLSG